MSGAFQSPSSVASAAAGVFVDAGLVRRFLLASRACAVTVAILGVLVLLGWRFEIALIERLRPWLGAMGPGSALALVLSGASLWLLHPAYRGAWPGRLGRLLSLALVVGSALTISGYLFRDDVGIDGLFYSDPALVVQAAHPARMSMVAALGFLLVGAAMLLVALDSRAAQRTARVLALATLLMSLIGLLGYVYGKNSLYAMSTFSGVAVHTVAALLALAGGILAVQPARGYPTMLVSTGEGGQLSRRLLPFAVAIPLAAGWMRLEGERAGFYQTEMGVDLMVITMVMLLVALIWWNARLLEAASAAKERAQAALRESEAAVRALAVTDPLTGLANRRRLDEALRAEIHRVQRYGGCLSVVMTDLDHFKRINDDHGHQVGDAVLQEFARIIRGQCRDTDLVARFGGEEFMILMPEIGAAEAQACAERIRAALAQAIVPPLVHPFTASFGVTELLPGETEGSLLRRVDTALYRGKSAGRNRVVLVEGGERLPG